MENIKVESQVTDAPVYGEGEVVHVVKDGEYVGGENIETVEEGIEDLQKSLEEMNLRNIVEKDESLSEDEKKILIEGIDENGNIEFNKITMGALKKAVNDTFNNEENNLKKLLPYLYTTDKDSIKHPIEVLDVTVDGITYYLKDDFKRLAISGEGDSKYEFYLSDAAKMHISLEQVKILNSEEKDIKLDVFLEYLGILQEVEKILEEDYIRFITNNAYVTAIDEVYENTELIKKLSKSLDNRKRDRKYNKRDYSVLKGFFFKKMFKNTKGVPKDLVTDFSELLDSIADMFILAYERNVVRVDKTMEEHVKDINEKNYVISKNKAILLSYLVISDLMHVYKDPSKRWTFVSIENEIYNKNVDDSYLYKTYQNLLRGVTVLINFETNKSAEELSKENQEVQKIRENLLGVEEVEVEGE